MAPCDGVEPLGAQASRRIDVVSVKLRTFVLSALLGRVSGALYAGVVGFVSPSTFTLTTSIGFVAMTVLGGSGSLAGPLAAAVLSPSSSTSARSSPVCLRPPQTRSRPTSRTSTDWRSSWWWSSPRGLAGGGGASQGGGDKREPAAGEREITKRFGGLTAVDAVSFDVFEGTIPGRHRSQRGRQVDAVPTPHRLRPTRRGSVLWCGPSWSGASRATRCGSGWRARSRNTQLFDELTAGENVMVGCQAHQRRGFATAMLRLPSSALERP